MTATALMTTTMAPESASLSPALDLPDTFEAKNGVMCTVRQMGRDDIPQIAVLQKAFLDAADPKTKGYILCKEVTDFEALFDGGGTAIGFFDGDKLVAQTLVRMPAADHPGTGLEYIDLNVPKDHVSIAQGVIVHPEYQSGSGLGSGLTSLWKGAMGTLGRDRLYAKIEVTNWKSLLMFLHAGFQISALLRNDTDRRQTFLVEGTPWAARHNGPAENLETYDLTDISGIKGALASGMRSVGVRHDPDGGATVVQFLPAPDPQPVS